MKKLMAIIAALCMMVSMAACAEDIPEGMHFSVPAALLAKAEDTVDLSLLLVNPEENVVYTSSDELVATVDEKDLSRQLARAWRRLWLSRPRTHRCMHTWISRFTIISAHMKAPSMWTPWAVISILN